MTKLPTVAITMGDPCGIGPEVVAKAVASPAILTLCTPLVIGNSALLTETFSRLGLPISTREAKESPATLNTHNSITILDPHNLSADAITPGKVSAAAGRASVEWVKLAAQLCLSGDANAMATAPINKEAVSLSGYREIGHMELLQKITGSHQVATMLISGILRVVHLTTHRSLRAACDAVTKETVLASLHLTHQQFEQWAFHKPRIGVAALNPHASDAGLLGNEEAVAIKPAIDEANRLGLQVTGPVPADTLFNQAINGDYDVVLAMYHDQGHIPIKVHGLERSISINLGLPIIRTSVDHGTAFDIAGRGVAQSESMTEAIKLAAALASGQGLPRQATSEQARKDF